MAFYSAKDIPGSNNFMPIKMDPSTEIEEIFCGSQIRFHNQPIGVIVAESSQIANRASELVKVSFQQRGMSNLLNLLYNLTLFYFTVKIIPKKSS